jgi:hypothetical protein
MPLRIKKSNFKLIPEEMNTMAITAKNGYISPLLTPSGHIRHETSRKDLSEIIL